MLKSILQKESPKRKSGLYIILGFISVLAECISICFVIFIPIYGEYAFFCGLDAFIRLLISFMAVLLILLQESITNRNLRGIARIVLSLSFIGNLVIYLFAAYYLSLLFTPEKIEELNMKTQYLIGVAFGIIKFIVFTYLVFLANSHLK